MICIAYLVLVVGASFAATWHEKPGSETTREFITVWLACAVIYGLPLAVIVWALTVILKG